MKIVLIDDDFIILSTTKKFLEKEGFEVIAFTEANEGMQHLSHNDVDLLICDIMMPFMSGIEILDEVKKIKAELPVILISALDQREVILTAFKSGADDFVRKPVDMEELMIRVMKALPEFDFTMNI